jgi:hypothetical protein
LAAFALILKIIGGIMEITSFIYVITMLFKRKKRPVLIGVIFLIVAIVMLVTATNIEDKLRAGYYYYQ